MDIREYQTEKGVSPFADWFGGLDAIAAAKVATAMTRLSLGNTSQVKGVGSGVFEVRINFGPGYRVYFGKDGQEIVILLTSGTKKKQQREIATSHAYWKDYKKRKEG